MFWNALSIVVSRFPCHAGSASMPVTGIGYILSNESGSATKKYVENLHYSSKKLVRKRTIQFTLKRIVMKQQLVNNFFSIFLIFREFIRLDFFGSCLKIVFVFWKLNNYVSKLKLLLKKLSFAAFSCENSSTNVFFLLKT